MALLHPNVTSWNKTTAFFVHGVGFQPVAFSEPLYKILRAEDPVTADATRWHEVVYDQANDAMKHKVVEFQNRIPAIGTQPGARDLLADFLNDLANYLVSKSPYDWINNFARKAIVEALKEGNDVDVLPEDHKLVLITHSLGTVVSYELLHSIISDPQVPGLSSGVKIKAYLTMGSPLAFIKANTGKIPTLNKDAFLRKASIGRPWIKNGFTGENETNIDAWYNFRQKIDPVGSLVALDQKTANGALTKDTFVFDALHTGLNPHDFGNYVTEYKTFIMDLLRA